MRKCILLVVVILTGISCSGQQKLVKGKLFIIGGGSRPDEMVERIVNEAGLRQGGYAVILPMSSIEPDSAVFYARVQFVKKGIDRVYGLNFVKDGQPSRAKLDSIRNARLIYISGGDQNRFMKVVLGTEIEKAIKDAYQRGGIVGGTSAGAAVMSKLMITGNELKHPDYSSTFRNIEAENIEIKPGLGLLQNVIIDQHFIRRSRHNRLISAVIEYPDMQGIGIDEATAILVNGNEAEVIGDSQVVVLENTKRSKKVKNGKLGASGIQMSVLLPGDKFRVR
jgi:cyanophycinase